MIKARPVAGDRDAGRAFLGQLKPFIWRKHLDFAAIQDIHSIKRQIHAVRGHREVAVGGHNIKLGRGGIREIEFFAQTQQLIWGGRDPTLRQPATIPAIRALALGPQRPAARCQHRRRLLGAGVRDRRVDRGALGDGRPATAWEVSSPNTVSPLLRQIGKRCIRSRIN